MSLISNQSIKIYKVLLKKDRQTAEEIAKTLNVFPNTIYRAINPLIAFGCVRKIETYPILFHAEPLTSAVNFYELSCREQFLKQFNSIYEKDGRESLGTIFIKDRESLYTHLIKDIERADNKVDLIVSGLEVSSEVMLAIYNAIQRGVVVRVLVQRSGIDNREMLHNWQKLGVKVRYCRSIEARIFVMDKGIIYITSYEETDPNMLIGIKFSSIAFGQIIKTIFEEKWDNGHLA